MRCRSALLLVPLLVPLLILAACGGDDDSATSTSKASAGSGATATATTAAAPLGPAADDARLDAVKVDGAFGSAPSVTVPTTFQTDQTVRRVLQAGTGTALADGATVVFDYLAFDATSGKEIARSFGDAPANAQLTAGNILPGIAKGLLGVNVGSRVLIAMAPADAFGPTGGIADQGVGATDMVLFVVDVRDVRTPLARAQGTPVAPVAGQPTVTLDASGAPTITMPGGTAPTTLVTQPLITGTGPAVTSGQTITVHYVGAIWALGKVFDSSWSRGQPASFTIGTGNVIPGWDQGLVGQHVGSQVLLVIPPALGYGASGNTDAGISGTDTLVFVVDLLDAY